MALQVPGKVGLQGRNMTQYKPSSISPLEHICSLDIDDEPHFFRMSNIVCTIGTSSDTPEMLETMMNLGMNIARLNLTLGSYKYHTDIIKNIRQLEKKSEKGLCIGIAVDITSPTVRTGLVNNSMDGEIQVAEGGFVTLTTNDEFKNNCTDSTIWLDNAYFSNVLTAMKKGDRIYIDDGALSLIVRENLVHEVRCLVEQGGKLGSSRRCHLPRATVYKHCVLEKYRQNLLFAVENEVEFIFASFIENGQDVRRIRDVIGHNSGIKIIAKIETKVASKTLESILSEADGLMICRVDLGLDLPPEKVFVVQKSIIAHCLSAGKPVFVVGQMLESMRYKPRPTRAEVSDVANAILDGADGLVLSVETAKGAYVRESLTTMHEVAREAESANFHQRMFLELKRSRPLELENPLSSTAVAAVEASIKCQAAAIIVVTTTGKSGQAISSYRPVCPILTITRKAQVARDCHLYRGMHPILYSGDRLEDWSEDMDQRINYAIMIGRDRGFLFDGDRVIIVTGWIAGSSATNTVRVFEVPKTNTQLHVVRSTQHLCDMKDD